MDDWNEIFFKIRKVMAFIAIIVFTFQITYFWSLFTGKGYPFLFFPVIFFIFFFLSNKYLAKKRK